MQKYYLVIIIHIKEIIDITTIYDNNYFFNSTFEAHFLYLFKIITYNRNLKSLNLQ